MSNNKSNSPFFAIGQGINNLLDYEMIARAGAPRNFLGTAIGAVGSLISRLDFSEMVKSDKEKIDDSEVDTTLTEEELRQETEDADRALQEIQDEEDEALLDDIINNSKKVNVTTDATGGGGDLPAYKKAYGGFSTTKQTNYDNLAKKAGFNSGYDYYVNEQENLSAEAKAAKESVRDYAKKYLGEGVTFDENNPDHKKGYEKSEFYNPLGITGGKSNVKPKKTFTDEEVKNMENKAIVGNTIEAMQNTFDKEITGNVDGGQNLLFGGGVTGFGDGLSFDSGGSSPTSGDKLIKQGSDTLEEGDFGYDFVNKKGVSEGGRYTRQQLVNLANIIRNLRGIDTKAIIQANKKGSPKKRLRPEILEIIEDSRYKRKGKDDTKLHRIGYFLRSPFYQTKNRPYKLLSKVAETPGDAFSLLPGPAGMGINPATQAYNAVIESENYRRKVENQFDEDLTKQVTSLDVDLSGSNITGQQRQDLLDLSLNNKKQLSEAFQKYADGKMSKAEYEMLKSNLLAEVNTLSSDLGLIKTKAQDYLNKKDNIDLAASNPLYADFFETAIRNPDSIRIVEIDGKKYFKGTTNAGQDFKIEVGAISNGDASFLLTEKADATSYIKNALGAMKSYVVETQTATGFGEKQLQDNTQMVDGKLVKSKIRTIGENSLIANLKQNPDNVRSLLAQYRGINYEAYQTLINQDIDGDGKVSSKEIQQNENMLLGQLAEELYDEFVGPQYNPQTRTTQRNTQRRGSGGSGGKLTAAERKLIAIKQRFDALPVLSDASFSLYNSQLDPKRFVLKKDDKGFFIGDIAKKTRIDIPENPVEAKRLIASYAGLQGYNPNMQINTSGNSSTSMLDEAPHNNQ